MNTNTNDDVYGKLKAECPQLFDTANKYNSYQPYVECANTWAGPISKLCKRLELLNNTICKKFGIVIVANQIKEKFGTLRFYYEIVYRKHWYTGLINRIRLQLKPDFGMKMLSYEKDGQHILEFKPTKHKWLYKIIKHITNRQRIGQTTCKARNTCITALCEIIDDLIDMAELECFGICEVCGKAIGNEKEPRHETPGWITYVCSDCLTKLNLKINNENNIEINNENSN